MLKKSPWLKLLLVPLLFTLFACAKGMQNHFVRDDVGGFDQAAATVSILPGHNLPSNPPVVDKPAPSDKNSAEPASPPMIHHYEILTWETSGHPERHDWSLIIFRYVEEHFSQFALGQDITDFCPPFPRLNHDQRVSAIGQFIVGLIWNESQYKTTDRLVESGIDDGIDHVTNLPLESDGLMSISYSDNNKKRPYCSRVDWSADKTLPADSPQRTIFIPEINLQCGIGILASAVANAQNFKNDGYFSKISPKNKNQTIIPIENQTQTLPICQTHGEITI